MLDLIYRFHIGVASCGHFRPFPPSEEFICLLLCSCVPSVLTPLGLWRFSLINSRLLSEVFLLLDTYYKYFSSHLMFLYVYVLNLL